MMPDAKRTKFPSDGYVPDIDPSDPRGGFTSQPDHTLAARINQGAFLTGDDDLYYCSPRDALPYGVPTK